MRTQPITSVIALLLATLGATGCSDDAAPSDPAGPVDPVAPAVPEDVSGPSASSAGSSSSEAASGSGGSSSSAGGSGGSSSSAGGASEGGSGEGGSQPQIAPEESCPGAGFALGASDSVSIAGTTTGKVADHTIGCVVAPGPDAVYRLDLAEPCSLSIGLADAGFDGAFSLRRGSCDNEVGCFDRASDDEHTALHAEAGTWWIVVQGASQSAGDYVLDVACSVPVCGDGVENPGEQCDPAAPTSHDGCGDPGTGSECRFVSALAADTCDDVTDALSIPVGVSVWPAGDELYDSSDAVDDYVPECASVTDVGGRDEVIAFVPQDSGLLRITVGADRDGIAFCQNGSEPECWHRYVAVRESDCVAGRVQVCATDEPATGLTELSVTVIAGQTYFVVVDGRDAGSDASGPYLVRFALESVPVN